MRSGARTASSATESAWSSLRALHWGRSRFAMGRCRPKIALGGPSFSPQTLLLSISERSVKRSSRFGPNLRRISLEFQFHLDSHWVLRLWLVVRVHGTCATVVGHQSCPSNSIAQPSTPLLRLQTFSQHKLIHARAASFAFY